MPTTCQHKADPATVIQPDADTYEATCIKCGEHITKFLLEDDDRLPRWSRWITQSVRAN